MNGESAVDHRVETDGGVALVTLERPAQYNALTAKLVVALTKTFAALERDPNVRALVLTGAGKGFCSGQSLDDPALKSLERDVDVFKAVTERYNPLLRAMLRMEKPIIAAVNGVAAGAGLGLALACDLRFASETASFTTAFTKIGLVPDSGVSFLLPRMIGYGRAMEAVLLSDRLDARRAYELGIVNRICEGEKLLDEAREVAARLAAGPRALGFAKRELVRNALGDVEAALLYEGEMQALAGATADFAEGIAAFREKRPPVFEGR